MKMDYCTELREKLSELNSPPRAHRYTRRVLFQPETTRVVVGQTKKNGKVKQKYVNAITLLKDDRREESRDDIKRFSPKPLVVSGKFCNFAAVNYKL